MRKAALTLIIIGAINWLIIGIFNYDPITALLGSTIARVIFCLVGIAGLFSIPMLFERDRRYHEVHE